MNMDVLAAIAAVQLQTDSAGILAIVSKFFGDRGFERFIVSALPDRGQDVRPFVLLSGWNQGWHDRYADQGYVHLDPVARHCFATSMPFAWSDAPYDRANDLPARRVMDEARDFGMNDGLCIPVHMDDGMKGAISLVGNPGLLRQVDRLELHLFSLYVHGQLRAIKASDADEASRRAVTAREAEMLKWAASGKTASDIAVITGLAERTVNQHFENAQKRLGTSNRLHTVVEAIRHRLIVL